MKVKTWIRRYVSSSWIEDEVVRNMLLNNNIYSFFTYKEQILDIDLNKILDECNCRFGGEPGYQYSNRLHDFIHDNSIFVLEKENLEYEIIEDGYPSDIPYAYYEFDDVTQFHEWVLREGIKERGENL